MHILDIDRHTGAKVNKRHLLNSHHFQMIQFFYDQALRVELWITQIKLHLDQRQRPIGCDTVSSGFPQNCMIDRHKLTACYQQIYRTLCQLGHQFPHATQYCGLSCMEYFQHA